VNLDDAASQFASAFTEMVKLASRRNGLLKKELAHKCGMRADRLSHLANGHRTPRNRDEVLRIAQGLTLDDAETDRLLRSAGFRGIVSLEDRSELAADWPPLSPGTASMPAATMLVRGEALVPGEPDQLELTITVTVSKDAAEDALAEATRLSTELGQLLMNTEIEASAQSSPLISIRRHVGCVEGRSMAEGYRAHMQAIVRFSGDRSVSQSLASRLMSQANLLGIHVVPPRWQFSQDNFARMDACRQATGDAKRKAQAYAAGLNMRLGAVLSLRELTTSMNGQPSLDTVSSDSPLEVHASVEVTFRLEPESGARDPLFLGPDSTNPVPTRHRGRFSWDDEGRQT
jgi:uncharacterized protein YggE